MILLFIWTWLVCNMVNVNINNNQWNSFMGHILLHITDCNILIKFFLTQNIYHLEMRSIRMILVRHGQTDFNRKHLLQGNSIS